MSQYKLATLDSNGQLSNETLPSSIRKPGKRRVVRGITYAAKNSSVDITAPFNRDDYVLDTSVNPNPRFQNMDVTGHSWTQYSPTPGGLWHTRLSRLLGIPTDQKKNIGVSGGTALNSLGGFPCDGQAARTLQQYAVATADPVGYGTLARNWNPWTSLCLLFIGYNDPILSDYYGGANWEVTFKAAMRAYFSAWRTARHYAVDSTEFQYTGTWTQTAATNLNMGTKQATATGLAYVGFKLPDDYEGQPVAIHYHADNSAAFFWYANVYLDSTVVKQFNSQLELIARGYQSAANGSNPGGGVQYPGVFRHTGFTKADAGKNVLLEYVAPNGGDKVSFDGISFEVDTPILVGGIPYLPQAIGGGDKNSATSPNGRQVKKVAQLIREVIDEYPANSIAYMEWTSDNLISAETAEAWNGPGDPHLTSYGNGLLAEEVYNNLKAATNLLNPLRSAQVN